MDHHDDRAGTQGQQPGQGLNPSHDSVRPVDGEAERVEDYLRLEEYIAQLQAERRPRRPRRMAPGEARVYQTAALLRAARSGATDPDPQFAARLRSRLEQEVRGANRTRPLKAVSRRNLLAGGLSVAAAAAGVAVGIGVDRATQPSMGSGGFWHTDLVPNGTWLAVASVDAIPVGGVQRFATDSLVGFVRHTTDGFSALSGACTHMGCLVNWNGAARTFDCPCHGGRFLESGQAAPTSPVAYSPLPKIDTMVRDNQVYVLVPASGGATDPNGSGGTGGGYTSPSR